MLEPKYDRLLGWGLVSMTTSMPARWRKGPKLSIDGGIGGGLFLHEPKEVADPRSPAGESSLP